MSDDNLDILGIVPAGLPHPGLALALARAGGAGILDLEFTADATLAQRNFRQLCEASDARIGLRIVDAQTALARRLIEAAGERSLTLVIAGSVRNAREALGTRTQDFCLAEITGADEAEAARGHCDALLLRGHEAGGWVGEDTSYILLQKLRAGPAAELPLYVQGGIGLHSAAACRAAGAAGVVLDDCLLLLAESPLPEALKTELGRLNGAETRLYGEPLGAPCRVYARPASAGLEGIDAATRAAESTRATAAQWTAQLESRIGWDGDAARVLPLGQGIGLAQTYRRRYRSVGRLVQAVRRAASKQIDAAAELAALDENGALAVSHGTRYPLCQGPMTRVSDSAAFAAAVADGGALPFLALALMRGPQVAQMLSETRARIGDRPWGVGMLGFVPQALREEQCAEIWKCKPPFALIAGGRPDQAAEFEQRGIATYIHAPAPALLKLYLEQGARRFVFEGRECGGHIGPLASFPLWEQMIELLLDQVPAGEEGKVHVLFAGGIHDAVSGAMVAAMAAPLAARGMKVGALMGTAYLFTREIVESGAIVEGFQAQALHCTRTMSLETGPGHSTRCVDTKFAHDFYETRRRLIGEGRSAEEIRDQLEALNLGRLRLASKGVDRDADGRIVEIPPQRQLDEGMYMIGQVATLRREVTSIAALHAEVCTRGQQHLQALASVRRAHVQAAKPSDVAIVGIGVLLPGAGTPQDYWHHIVHRIGAIGEIPAARWDWQQYFDADRKARDKVYSRWGGFLDEISFDPMRFGIPPKSMKAIDPMQLLTLEVASRALFDAGYADGGFDRETTSIILGAGGGLGDLGLQYGVRAELPRFVENISEDSWERLPEWTEESFAGSLLNVAAGRVANRLDLGGVNFTVDAACASSLAAISLAVGELESGRSSMVLAGGVDTVQSPFGYLCFSKTQALSPTGEPKTFDQNADGIAISEGLAVVALKRLADAERDGDRVYAVIKAVAGSSDGKALGLTAPRPEGQLRALTRAYAKAGFSPATLGLLEAHGTGTAVGDRAEAQTVTRALAAENAAPKSVALGSVKTLIGHTKASAGVAGLIKAALALHHRVLPAHHGVSKPIDTIAEAQAPVYLLKDARPWLAHPQHPRRAGVSAFGFGGTNFHAVLEEYPCGGAGGGAGTAGERAWPAELFVFRCADQPALERELIRVRELLGDDSRVPMGELAFALARSAAAKGAAPLRLAIVAGDRAALTKDIDTVLAQLRGAGQPLPAHVRLNRAVPAQAPALAFLFPGQGAQYVGMGREAALYLDELREALELADRRLLAEFPERLSSRMLPPSAFDAETEAAQNRALTDTRVAQPAIGALALGYLGFARRLGLVPAAVAGHSYGEYVALHAAGVFAAEDLLRLSAARGQAMAEASKSAAPGGMAAVQAARARIAAAIARFDGVQIANHNAPEQSVISGPKAAVEAAVQALAAENLRAVLLPVSGAFHTALVAAAQAPLSAAIRATPFAPPQCAVYANSSGAPYPSAPAAMQALLEGHLLSSVEFVAQIEAMHAAGCRVFVELGPKSICSTMVRQILAGRDALAVSFDAGNGLRGTLMALAELYAAGAAFDVLRLFETRDLDLLELQQLSALAQPVQLPRHVWMVSGGCARPLDDPQHRTGRLPPLTKASAQAARARTQADPVVGPASARQTPPSAVGLKPELQQPGVPATAQPTVSPALASEALVAYQQTMRQFLQLQERVIQQFLGTGLPAAMPPAAAALPEPIERVPSVAPAPVIAAPPQAESGIQPAGTSAGHPDHALGTAGATSTVAPAVDFKSLLLGLVAERTGYPEDMLGLEADLEAELGIDSIKRVEILGAFQKALPADIGAAMQAAMERFTRARSLAAILAQVQALAPAVAAAPTAGAAPATAAAGASVDFKSLLLGLVAERTGYPEDMLGLEADLEAELGIDSIKRVEILGAFQKALPADIGAAMQAAMEGFTRSRTLSAILNEVRALAPGAAAPAVPAVPPPPSAGAEAAQAAPRIPRYVLKPQPAALHGSSVSLSGLALVLGGPDTVKRVLHPALTAAGMTPVDIDSTAPDALRLAIAQARAAHGPVRALLHLHGLHSPAVETLDDWRDQYRRELLSLFHAAQALGGELAQLRVLAATRLGGTFGRDTIGPGSITAGGVVGMLNCLRQEFPESAMRAVDFDSQTDAQIAQLLLAELQTEDAQPEAGYVGAERHGAVTVEQPLVESPFSPSRVPQADWIVLATGGARGITAELLEELVQPGMRLVLVGRSAEPVAEDPASAALEDPQQLRKALIAMLAAAGGKPKPAEVDRALARLLADREIRANLARLRSAGAEVEYVACDVRDERAFGALIDRLYERHGRIDLVLHGAGVIEDRLLADKTAESFERVLATKLDPAFVLSRRLRPESLKAIAFFTSVAGRYGNRGQTDYAAANETLNRLAWDLQRRWPETRVVAINWGPWDAGMASEGVKRAFRERGIEPIPVAAGRRLFREELAFAPRHDVELVAGRGPWGQQPAPADAGTADAVAAELPLLRGTPRLGPGGHMLLDHTFSVASDPYLDDHRMDGKAVLPAAGALEWMAQFAAAAWPGAQVAEIRDLRLFNGIVLDGDEVSVQLRARAATHSEPDAQSVSVEILNPARKLPCYRATVVLRQRLPDAQLLAVTPLDTPQPFSAEEAYSTLLFHGPRFQLVTSIDGVDAAGLDARVLSTMPAEWLAAGRPGSWLFDPGLVDVPPQMALVWGRLQRQMSALPSRFGSVRRYGAEPLPRSLRLALRLRPASQDASVVYDAFYFDQAGRLRLELRDCESTLSAALNRLGGQAGPAVRRAPEVLT